MDYLKIKIKTLWNGRVACRENKVNEARLFKKGIKFVFHNQIMFIPYLFLDSMVVVKSKNKYKDRFSTEWHYLIYYDWKPYINDQPTLF